jgi:hypothetical protein
MATPKEKLFPILPLEVLKRIARLQMEWGSFKERKNLPYHPIVWAVTLSHGLKLSRNPRKWITGLSIGKVKGENFKNQCHAVS